jgi:hypothetical protein
VNAVFLTTAFVFGDETGRLFQRITNSTNLNAYSWIFDPNQSNIKSDEEIMAGCTSFFQPAGYNRVVVPQWPYNLRLLLERYDSDVRNFFDIHGGDMEKIIKALIVRPRAKTVEKIKKGAFTRYGPKIAPLVVQWIDQYGLYEFDETSRGRLPIDFQVARVLIQTGGIVLDQPENSHQVTTAVGETFKQLTDDNGWESRLISEALWNIGNQGCNKKQHEACPVEQECDRLISRTPYDRGGKFDPKDVGRWE